MDGKVSLRPYGTQWLYGLMTQDFILHPTDEDLSVGTPAWAIFTHSLLERRTMDNKPKSCEIPGLEGETWALGSRLPCHMTLKTLQIEERLEAPPEVLREKNMEP